MQPNFAKPLLVAGIISLATFLLVTTSLQADTLQAPSPTPTPVVKRASTSTNGVFLPMVIGAGMPVQSVRNKGVGITYDDCASASTVGAFWIYAWGGNPPTCNGVESVPMIWGASEVNATLGGNSNWVMGFNEPDSASQANLTLAQAVSLWRQIEQKYPARKLVAPAPTGANPDWIVNFRNTYISTYGAPPRLDALAVHCYAWYASQCVTHTQKFTTWANSWNASEVWVTEFSFSPASPSSPNQSLNEARSFISWMQSAPKVTRYAWFASKMQGNEWWALPSFITPLVDWNTLQPTTYGQMYLPYQ